MATKKKTSKRAKKPSTAKDLTAKSAGAVKGGSVTLNYSKIETKS